MRFVFLTFGGPDRCYHEAVDRLVLQAKNFGIFDEIVGLTEKDLQTDAEFWDRHSNFIESNRRGYGYWIWKPYIISKYLSKLADGDVLLYADCGCELNINGVNKMTRYVELTKRYKIIGTSTTSNDINYTKRDLVERFFGEVNERNVHLLLRGHIQAGCMMMENCELSRSIFNEFYEVCADYRNIDDTPSVSPNDPTFVEHRHDQSVFNMIMKRAGLHNYLLDPAYFHPDWNKYGKEYPVWYSRNKTGDTRIE